MPAIRMRYSFGKCRLDVESRELLRDHEAVHLSPKAFELLRLLIENRPRVMSKQELMDALWRGTFVVEANLPVLIGEVRTALGEKSSGAGSIKTHHGIGYSFVADVQQGHIPVDDHQGAHRVALITEGRRVALGTGGNDVGRDPEGHVFLNDPSVSRKHARITVADTNVTIEDLLSKNGTLLNGVRIGGTVALENGDAIRFGNVEARVIISPANDPSTLTITN